MIKDISKIFPDAKITHQPVFTIHDYCYFDKRTNKYFILKKNTLTEREMKLLDAMFSRVEKSVSSLNQSTLQMKWYDFLFGDEKLPIIEEKRVRFIQFYIDTEINQADFLTALESLLREGMIAIWLNEKNGVLIEDESVDSLLQADFLSLTEAVLSDFYFSVTFYVGRFFSPDASLKNKFKQEQVYFQCSRPFYPNDQIITFEKAFPFVLLTVEKDDISSLLKAEYEEIFQYDNELLQMIKTFLEHHSNTSSTAKALYMHRNSLQYRIDKFMDQSSINIKDFLGALSIYFICLYGASQSNIEK